MTEPILRVVDVQVSYGRVQAVRGVSFDVMPGEIVALVGANGAGKSSLINAVAGIRRPSSGAVHFLGENITRKGAHDLVRRGLVQVPEGRQILKTLTIAENLQLGSWHHAADSAARIAEMCERFPVLGQRRHLLAGSLSGGEQQMLAIARAMLARPGLILMDEPSMGLAPKIVDEVFDVIGEIRSAGTTVVLVEQNARRALAAADYGHVMQNGEIVRSGPSAELLADEAIVAAYLGVSSTHQAPNAKDSSS